MPSTTETAREREVFKYEAFTIAGTVPTVLGATPSSLFPIQVQFRQDPILAGLAQLCAVRLQAACAYVSFFDMQYQHVVACANSTSSILRTDARSDLLGVCGRAFTRNSTISEHVLRLEDLTVDGDEDAFNHGANLPISNILDLAADPEYSQHIFVTGENRQRWYAAVPIKSPKGVNIGVLSAYHPEPRSEILSEDGSRALREISLTITKHMELHRAGESLRRNERMVRGLGSFVEGNSSMSFSAVTDNAASFANEGGEGSLNPRQQLIQQRSTDNVISPGWRRPEDTDGSVQGSNPLDSPNLCSDSPSPPQSIALEGLGVPTAGASTASITIGSDTSFDDTLSNNRIIFSKAANMIRESLEVEGVLFLDASIGSFGGLVSKDERTSQVTTSNPVYNSSGESSADSLDERHSNGIPSPCSVFGFSTSDNSSIDNEAAASYHADVPEKLLSTLLKRYPRGRIFHFHADGTLSSGDSEEEKLPETNVVDFASNSGTKESPSPERWRAGSRPWSKRNEGSSILKVVPGARSVIFVPLWDAHKERWYAAGFVWTRTPTRLFTKEGELSYLQAFATSIMSETMRMDALKADKAKADVLGSLSHELRSPLHGVLAGVDLLRGELLNAFQTDILHSLESCGRTLLDVVNHLLDYSKVNTYIKEARQQRQENKSIRTGPSPKQAIPHRALATVRLDVLMEETINSVFAGHAFQMMSIAQSAVMDKTQDADVAAMRQLDITDAFESFGHQGHAMSEHGKRLGRVTVFLQIDPRVDWTFCTDPGAIRRILLNVFGNSLKYTHTGFVCVSLHQETVYTKSKHPITRLKLTVADSGKGITSRFLQQNLFTPFSQEDSLAPGTGLGLSLVKQIIRTLSGSITVESQVGLGTCVRISVPLKKPTEELEAEEAFAEQKEALRGLRVSLAGLTRISMPASRQSRPAVFAPPTGSEIIGSICSDWLKMQVVDIGNLDIKPDLILCDEAGLPHLGEHGSFSEMLTPTVVVCSDAVTAHSLTIKSRESASDQIIEYISQPVGPRKLAKALEAALTRWIELVKRLPSQTDSDYFGNLTSGLKDISVATRRSGSNRNTAGQAPEPSTGERNLTYEHHADKAFPPTAVREVEMSPGAQVSIEKKATNGNDALHVDISPTSPLQEVVSPSSPMPAGDSFLLVDDNKINLQILVSFMKKLNRSYHTASNGLEAYERFTEVPGRFNCVLMDLSMPVMDGLESCRRIREFERDLKLPKATVVALTGLASVETQREAYASGMDVFYTKPVKLKDLAAVISDREL